jgi:hypothetical protein
MLTENKKGTCHPAVVVPLTMPLEVPGELFFYV